MGNKADGIREKGHGVSLHIFISSSQALESRVRNHICEIPAYCAIA